MRRGSALVGILLVVAIIAVLVVVMYGKGVPGIGGGTQGVPARPDGKGGTVIGRAKFAAKDDECRNGLSQVRAALAIATDPVEGSRPETLAETRIGRHFTQCPVGSEPYSYDPKSGKVQCPHRGHDSY